jgi:hypothetical protein
MKTKYLVKLNGKTISTRVVKKKVVCLQILHCETTGVFKSPKQKIDIKKQSRIM